MTHSWTSKINILRDQALAYILLHMYLYAKLFFQIIFKGYEMNENDNKR
jgi:hypothetical protein